jgi:alpha-glucosidase
MDGGHGGRRVPLRTLWSIILPMSRPILGVVSIFAGSPRSGRTSSWWRGAVIYQVYPRSFADGNGDGIGDLAGIRARLPYLADLGVDAIWISPWYPSPMADGGYDVADYRDIDPVFGTLAEAEALIAEAHALGHPDDHRHRPEPHLRPSTRGSRRRWPAGLAGARPVLVPARPRRTATRCRTTGESSSAARPGPGSRTARRVVPAPVRPRAARPQLGPPDVRAEFEDILRFWFDRGVDGIRIDSAALLIKDPTCRRSRGDDGRPRSTRTSRRACTRSTGPGGASPTRTARRRC